MATPPTIVTPGQSSLPSYAPIMMVPPQRSPSTSRASIRPVPGIKYLSIATIILASVSILLGVTAAAIKGRMSFLGDAIWTGLFFMLPCGILGVFVHVKRVSLCMNISFLVMAILSSVASFQLFIFTLVACTQERYFCSPDPSSPEWESYWIGYCTPQWSRIIVDVAIVVCALAVMILNTISASLTLYGTFMCCYNCCHFCNDGTPHTVLSNTNPFIQASGEYRTQAMGPMSQGMVYPNQQPNSNQYMVLGSVAGSAYQVPNQMPQQPTYIMMQPATNTNPSQRQPYAVYNYQQAPAPPRGPSTGVINQHVSPMGAATPVQPTMVQQQQQLPPGNQGNIQMDPSNVSAATNVEENGQTSNDEAVIASDKTY